MDCRGSSVDSPPCPLTVLRKGDCYSPYVFECVSPGAGCALGAKAEGVGRLLDREELAKERQAKRVLQPVVLSLRPFEM